MKRYILSLLAILSVISLNTPIIKTANVKSNSDISDRAISNKNNKLFLSVLKNNPKKVHELLCFRADANIKDKNNNTVLHHAVFKGYMEVVELLLNYGANINAKDNLGNTALILACKQNHKDIVELLMDRHANINIRNNNKNTPLHYAVLNNNIDNVKTLLYKNIDIEVDINAKNDMGMIPLHIATFKGYEDLTKILIGYENDVAQFIKGCEIKQFKTKTHDNKTALDLALDNGCKSIAKFLIKNKVTVDVRTLIGSSSLHKTSEIGDKQEIERLLQEGINPNAIDIQFQTPLHLAAQYNHKDIVELLIEYGADINAKDMYEQSPLHLANFKMTQILLDHGADINIQDKAGNTPLHYSVEYGCLDKVRVLLKYRFKLFNDNELINKFKDYIQNKSVNPNIQNNDGLTPLDISLFSEQTEVHKLLRQDILLKAVIANDQDSVNSLLKNKAYEVDYTYRVHFSKNNSSHDYSFSYSLLHFSILSQNVEMTRLLLRHGANVNMHINDSLGCSPLHLAIILAGKGKCKDKEGMLSIIKLLLNEGADPSLLDSTRNTPLYYASGKYQLEVMRLLLEKGADINAINIYDESPLHHFIITKDISKKFESIKFLIENGANVEAQDEDGKTILHLAIMKNIELFKFLLNAYCSNMLNIIDDNGNNALFTLAKEVLANFEGQRYNLGWAGQEYNIAIIKLCLDHGFDINARDDENNSLLSLYISANQEEVVKFLLDRNANIRYDNDRLLGLAEGNETIQRLLRDAYYNIESNGAKKRKLV